jgi:hypothetical protein
MLDTTSFLTQGDAVSKSTSLRKPRKDFPLFPHATGRWCKKVRGRFVYFGSVKADPRGHAALDLWLEQRDDLLAGRAPRSSGDGLTIRELCNRFLTVKEAQIDTREITRRLFDGASILGFRQRPLEKQKRDRQRHPSAF